MSSDHEGRRGSDESDASGSPDSRSEHGDHKHADHKHGSRSRSRSYHSDRAKYNRERSRTRSHSRGHRKRKYSYSRSRSRSYNKYSRSRSRSPYHKRSSRYSRSRSRDPSPAYSRDYKNNSSKRYGYGRSYSRSPPRYRGGGGGGRKYKDTSPMSNRRRHVGNRDKPEPTRCLGIFGLSLYTTERDLRDVFSRYGPLEEVQVVYDRQSGRSRGFCFIYFKNIEDSIEAKDRCAGQEIDGRRIRVDYSITQRAHTPTPGDVVVVVEREEEEEGDVIDHLHLIKVEVVVIILDQGHDHILLVEKKEVVERFIRKFED
ncbi:TRA2 [Mytilus edulis]|uniref:TRA2 n=1 Tax=Mytilus edulis TaxID=6550 RepID=A0A8S3QD69_MYTED|nr:TRA2 [Mytilus edulis]